MPESSVWRWESDDASWAVCLDTVEKVTSYASALETHERRNSSVYDMTMHRASGKDDEDDGSDDGDSADDDESSSDDEDDDGYKSAGSGTVPTSPTEPSSPTSAPPSPIAPLRRHPPPHPSRLRSLTIALPPPALVPPSSSASATPPPGQASPVPTHALAAILTACTTSLTHLSLSHTEALLALDPTPAATSPLARALARLSALTHLSLSDVGPLGCALLRSLTCELEEVEVHFDDAWAARAIYPTLAFDVGTGSASVSLAAGTLVPALPDGEPSGLPSPATATVHAGLPHPHAAHSLLPDPIPLLAHSARTLRILRASNAALASVEDVLRYPTVRTLSLRLAGAPALAPLVHAFPAVRDLYVYTPFDGFGVQVKGGVNGEDALEATRAANRAAQVYSAFAPLERVRGFARGLYALGLACPVKHLEVGAVEPPFGFGLGLGLRREKGKGRERSMDEAEMVRLVLADTRPARVGVTLGGGWWAADEAFTLGTSAREEKNRAKNALRTLFDPGEDGSACPGWNGVKELVVRIGEAGRWRDVTRDVSAMLRPLSSVLSTFVLRWDRMSVPFDRLPPEDSDDPGDFPEDTRHHPPPSGSLPSASMPASHTSDLRTERFARRLAEDIPALRYISFELMCDTPPTVCDGGAPPPSSRSTWPTRACQSDPTLPRPSSLAEPRADAWLEAPPLPTTHRYFWRVDREGDGRWLCLDWLGEARGRKVLGAAGLAFEDGVRY
ncbi:hypothetical protein C8Q78DRAFT_1077567 [Trametes maxima]|nr:hypothetical protein C8Q78DRAFT_1077567 [Trametes maxima]